MQQFVLRIPAQRAAQAARVWRAFFARAAIGLACGAIGACSAPGPALRENAARDGLASAAAQPDFGVDLSFVPRAPGAQAERFVVLADAWLRVGGAGNGGAKPVPVRAISPAQRDELARTLAPLFAMDESQGLFAMGTLDGLHDANLQPRATLEWTAGGRTRAALVLPTLQRVEGLPGKMQPETSPESTLDGATTPAWQQAAKALDLLRSWAGRTPREPLR